MSVGRQTDLVHKIRERSQGELVPRSEWVTKGEQEPVEFSQRTRSLLFAVLGLLVARVLGKRQILFLENGITSFNLPPCARHVLGEPRRVVQPHPRVFPCNSSSISVPASDIDRDR